MAATELQPKVASADDENIIDEEARSTYPRLGGWITFPFVSVSLFGSMLASSGLFSNLIVYLIGQFNIKSIDAAQISNIVSGCTNLLPIAGAIIADSFLGNFTVIAITSFISVLGAILLMLTTTIHSLKPAHCGAGFCIPPSTLQYAALCTALVLLTLGFGGQRFTIAAMGADQFEKPKEHAVFFNWYFIIYYGATAIGSTGVVYIQDNVGWSLGYGICVAVNVLALVVFVSGKRYYHDVKPKGSPFASLARVIVATVRKRTVSVSPDAKAYYYGCSSTESTTSTSPPTLSFRFLNRAAIKTEGDTNELDGSLSKPWRLCTVQQVEDFKTLIRISPLWSSSIFVSVPIGMQYSLTVLQALTMDRHIGPNFKIPAGTILVFNLITTVICLVLIDRFLFTIYQKLTGRSLTPLQRIGVGHIFNILGMATAALVESKRLHVAGSHNLVDKPNSIVPLSALWVVAPLAVTGIGEAFHFPGQVVLYYEEFPKSLKSTSTAMIAMLVAVGFYLSTAVIDLLRRLTGWLPDNINKGRIDNVFWFLVVIGVINFGYYLICATLYKHQNGKKSIQNVEKSSMDNNYDCNSFIMINLRFLGSPWVSLIHAHFPKKKKRKKKDNNYDQE